MTEKKVSQRYARALYQLAVENGKLEEVLADLTSIIHTIAISKDLDRFFKSPLINSIKKGKIFNEIFSGKLGELSFKFIELLIKKQRESFVASILVEFENIYNIEHGIVRTQITTAIEVDEKIKDVLLSKISQIESKKIKPTFIIDEDIKGGFKFLIDGTVYDQTVSSKLEKIYEELV